jgi:hypothetical protein
VSEIRVSGKDLSGEASRIESLDITAHGVGIGDHAFSADTGRLQAVSIPRTTGPSSTWTTSRCRAVDALTAVATSIAPAAVAFIQHALESRVVAVTGLELTNGGISLVIFEQRVEAAGRRPGWALVIAGHARRRSDGAPDAATRRSMADSPVPR